MFAAFQIISPSLEGFNNSQQLPIVGLILSLCQNHLSREKSYRIPLARVIRGQLIQNSTNSIAKNIRLNLNMTFQIKIIE